MSDTPASKPCPICGKPAAGKHMPFCSQRCSTIDLARWLTGGYRVAGEELPKEVDGEEPQKD